jgi:hypothetical protein
VVAGIEEEGERDFEDVSDVIRAVVSGGSAQPTIGVTR